MLCTPQYIASTRQSATTCSHEKRMEAPCAALPAFCSALKLQNQHRQLHMQTCPAGSPTCCQVTAVWSCAECKAQRGEEHAQHAGGCCAVWLRQAAPASCLQTRLVHLLQVMRCTPAHGDSRLSAATLSS